MQSWRKVIVWLVLLWLPVQGFAAGFMPFACHKQDTGRAAVAHHDAHHHESQAHVGHQAAEPEEGLTHGLACDDCTLCQLCAASALPAAALQGDTPLPVGVDAAPVPRVQSFIPPLPQRPPRTLLV